MRGRIKDVGVNMPLNSLVAMPLIERCSKKELTDIVACLSLLIGDFVAGVFCV